MQKRFFSNQRCRVLIGGCGVLFHRCHEYHPIGLFILNRWSYVVPFCLFVAASCRTINNLRRGYIDGGNPDAVCGLYRTLPFWVQNPFSLLLPDWYPTWVESRHIVSKPQIGGGRTVRTPAALRLAPWSLPRRGTTLKEVRKFCGIIELWKSRQAISSHNLNEQAVVLSK